MRRLIILTALAVVISLTSGPSAAQQQGENEAVVTVRGTALLPSGEPAANVPVVVKVIERGFPGPPPPGAKRSDGSGMFRTVASSSTGADGSFSFRIVAQPAFRDTLLIEFGKQGETAFLRASRQVDGRELDLKTVQLRAPLKARPRSGSGLCAAISICLPMALLAIAWPRPRSSCRELL